MNPLERTSATAIAPRSSCKASGIGLGAIALGSLLGDDARRRPTPRPPPNPLAPRPPHFAPQAKHVIYLHMIGAPSQLDLFDHKPALAKHDGQPCPAELLEGQAVRLHRRRADAGRHARSSSPGTARAARRSPSCCRTSPSVADDIAVVKTLHTEEINHAPAQMFLHTGFGRGGRPELRLVGHLRPRLREPRPAGLRRAALRPARRRRHDACGRSGFLPSVYQGIQFRIERRPGAVPLATRRATPPPTAAACSTRSSRAERGAARRRRRPGDRHAHQPVRDGVPHADVACPS